MIGLPFCSNKPVGGVRAACAVTGAYKVSRYILALQFEVEGLAYLMALPCTLPGCGCATGPLNLPPELQCWSASREI